MKILPTQRIYESLQVEANGSKSEILDILRERMKNAAKFTDDNAVIRMTFGESYLLGTGRVGFSISRNDSGNAVLNFDFYTRFPSILKTVTLLVTIPFTSIFAVIFFFVGFENAGELFLFYLKFMLTLPVLLVLLLLHEKVSRYTTKKFIQHIVRDFVK